MTSRRFLAAATLSGMALAALTACTAPASSTPTTAASSAMSASSSASKSASASASPSASASSASAKPSSASASASKSASASASPSASKVADATDAADFTSKMTAAIKKLKTFEYKATAEGNAGGTDAKGDATGIVDQTDPNNIKAKATGQANGLPVETIIIGKDAYLKIGDGKYKKAEVTDANQGTYLWYTEEWVKKAQKLKKVGTEKVNGVDTTHYVLSFDPGTIADNGIDVDAWMDDQFRPVKMFSDAQSNGVAGKTTVVMSNIDKPVDIKAPDASQVEG